MLMDKVGRQCCGCRACQVSCVRKAISFSTDSCGFEFPQIDPTLCINCGMCERGCPVLNSEKVKASRTVHICGAARSKNSVVLQRSSSGGMFYTLAQQIFVENGVVFGAAFDDDLKLKTIAAKNESEIIPLLKSKYLLCDTNDVIEKIKQYLLDGKPVLYCATPCQIAAVKCSLGDCAGLITVDFACHGVGNQKMFDESVNWYNQKHHGKLSKFVFRYKKKNAASSHYFSATIDGKEKRDLYFEFPYYNAYCKQLVCRDSCYECRFADRKRCADITIGDFHTVENYLHGIDRMRGISMILCNTEKGKKLFEKIAKQIDFFPMEAEILYKNNRFGGAGEIPADAIRFRKWFQRSSYAGDTKKLLYSYPDSLKRAYYHMPEFLRKAAKRIMERGKI